jgi:hypothetical protein
MTIAHATAARTAAADLIVDRIDAGSAAGKLKLYTASFGALMTSIDFSDPAFDAASGGAAVMTAGAITGTISLSGTNVMAKFRIEDSDGNEVLNGDVGLSGADINLTNTTFNQNDTVTINSITYTAMP